MPVTEKTKVSIIVPVYNEAENLPKLIKAIRGSLNGVKHEVIIIDDNSPDGTGKVADELAKEYVDDIRVIHRDSKKGVASAIATGAEDARGEILGTMNADQLQGPSLLPVMLEQIDQYEHDVVIASRYIVRGHTEKNFWRRLVSEGAMTIARIFLPRIRKVKDPLSGFFLFRSDVITQAGISSQSLSGNVSIGRKFILELLVKGNYKSVVELPFTDEKRESGKSKFNPRDYLSYLRHVLSLRNAKQRKVSTH